MLEDMKEGLSHKVVGLPGWAWLLIGVGLFWWFSKSSQQSPTSANYSMTTPTTDQMTGNAIGDLKETLQQGIDSQNASINDRFGEMIEATNTNNTATMQTLSEFVAQQSNWFQQLMDKEAANQNAMMGAMQDNAAQYRDAVAQSNQSFLTSLNAALATFKPNGTSTAITNDPGSVLPQWAQQALQDPRNRNRMYLQSPGTYLDPDGPYGKALSEYLRSDSPSGLNTEGQTQQGWNQLSLLLNTQQVVRNPYVN